MRTSASPFGKTILKCKPQPRDDLLYGLLVAALIAFVLAVILERTQPNGPASALSATAVAAAQSATAVASGQTAPAPAPGEAPVPGTLRTQ
jgi:hypothetical protein